jgi:hypothetical protein
MVGKPYPSCTIFKTVSFEHILMPCPVNQLSLAIAEKIVSNDITA